MFQQGYLTLTFASTLPFVIESRASQHSPDRQEKATPRTGALMRCEIVLAAHAPGDLNKRFNRACGVGFFRATPDLREKLVFYPLPTQSKRKGESSSQQ